MPNHEPTNRDLLEAIQSTSKRIDSIDGRLDSIDSRFDSIDGRLSTMDSRFSVVDGRFKSIDDRFDELLDVIGQFATHVDRRFEDVATKDELQIIKNRMVTKEYLDDKLADLRSDLVMLARKQNKKFETLVHELVDEGRLT